MTDETARPSAFLIERAPPLAGRLAVPGDRLAAHVALAAAALAEGESRLEGLPQTPEAEASLAILSALGVRLRHSQGQVALHGLGSRGLLAPAGILDLGTGELTAALGLGLAGILPMETRWTFGQGLDVARLVAPLAAAGARIEWGEEDRLLVAGPRVPAPLEHRPAGEAEALLALLVALSTPGTSTLLLPPDQAEALAGPLRAFGAAIGLERQADEARLTVTGLPRLMPHRLAIAGDPLEAAWAALAALIVPKSDIVIENVLVTPARTGLVDALLEMGGNIDFTNQREDAGEHVADLRVRSSFLRGTDFAQMAAPGPAGLAALAVAGACARGETRLPAADDLRTLASLLQEMGAPVTIGDSAIVVTGGRGLRGGGELRLSDAHLVLPLAILALAADRPVTFVLAGRAGVLPPLLDGLARLGARIEPIARSPTP